MQAPSQCPVCRSTVPPAARFCPVCGVDLHHPAPHTVTGLLPAQHRLHGRYIIQRKLAQGGQSAVYLALDLAAGNEKRAIKEMSRANLRPQDLDRAVNGVIREAKILSELDHPALAKVYELFVEDKKHFLAMEFVPGHTLEDEMIQRNRPVDWESVMRWGCVLCDVLSYLHSRRPPIVYRDLKPSNVMLLPDGSIKLIDFGIARQLLESQTLDTAQLGTDGYAPLEQYASRSEPRSDIYALGATLYHLLTGRVPESAPSRSAQTPLTSICRLNPRVPEAVQQAVFQALAPEMADRFQTAEEMRLALERVMPAGAQQAPRIPIPAATSAAPGPGQSGASRIPTAAPRTSVRSGGAATLAPRLYVAPLRPDAGILAPNTVSTLTLEVGNHGGGELTGTIESKQAGVSVDPTKISGATQALRIQIDTRNLLDGHYTALVAIRTNGGVQIVPVRFQVASGM